MINSVELVLNSPTHNSLKLGDGTLGLYVDGVPELITGKLHDWSEKADVHPVRLPGYWIHKDGEQLMMGQAPIPGEKVLYFMHGGSYLCLSAHPTSPTSILPRVIIKSCPSIRRAFNIEYRLSSIIPGSKEGAFPSALIDALAGYAYLVNTVGFDPKDIVVCGDSAGGNLAYALTRYLVEYQGQIDALPAPPAGLLLLAPWSDMSGTHSGPESSTFTNANSDTIAGPTVPYTPDPPDAFVLPHGIELTWSTPYVSPASRKLKLEDVTFKGFPKTFITSGDAEILLDQIRTLAERMKADLGDDLVYHEAKDAIHDFIVFDWHEPERSEALVHISQWVCSL